MRRSCPPARLLHSLSCNSEAPGSTQQLLLGNGSMPRPQLGTDEIDRVLHACCGRFGGPDGYHTYCKGLEVVLDALMGLARLLEDATAAALWAVAPALGLFKNNVNLDRRPALSAASATPASATAKPGPPAPSGRHGRSTTSCWQQQKQQAGSRRRCTSAAAAAPRGQLASWCRTGALDATIARAMAAAPRWRASPSARQTSCLLRKVPKCVA